MKYLLATAVVAALIATPAAAQVKVYGPGGPAPAVREAAAQFEKDTGIDIEVVSGPTPQWIENMTAGRGWIALALVVFASWLPWRAAVGAYLFGAISILAYTVQTFAWGIPSQFLSSLPYLVTIGALVVISGNRTLTRANTPACLGQSFVPDR